MTSVALILAALCSRLVFSPKEGCMLEIVYDPVDGEPVADGRARWYASEAFRISLHEAYHRVTCGSGLVLEWVADMYARGLIAPEEVRARFDGRWHRLSEYANWTPEDDPSAVSSRPWMDDMQGIADRRIRFAARRRQ